jgi:ankyrin repeat protein
MNKYFRNLLQLLVLTVSSGALAGAYVDFFRAVNIDNVSIVQDLLQRGFDPNSADEKGQTGLYLALREGSPKVAAALLADPRTVVDAANAAGETALMIAALRNRPDWVTRLIERGAAVNRDGWTPLHYAATGAEPAVLEILVARGALIEAASPNGTTALMMAARYGTEPTVDWLLARGASLAARNVQGLGAVDFARQGGRDRLAERLQRLAGR